jgi:uncharacterized membrane protein
MSKRRSDVELDQKDGMVVIGLAVMAFHFLTRPIVKGPLIAAVVMLVMVAPATRWAVQLPPAAELTL